MSGVQVDYPFSTDASYRHIWLEKIESQNVPLLDEKKFDDTGHMITVGLNVHF